MPDARLPEQLAYLPVQKRFFPGKHRRQNTRLPGRQHVPADPRYGSPQAVKLLAPQKDTVGRTDTSQLLRAHAPDDLPAPVINFLVELSLVSGKIEILDHSCDKQCASERIDTLPGRYNHLAFFILQRQSKLPAVVFYFLVDDRPTYGLLLPCKKRLSVPLPLPVLRKEAKRPKPSRKKKHRSPYGELAKAPFPQKRHQQSTGEHARTQRVLPAPALRQKDTENHGKRKLTAQPFLPFDGIIPFIS